MRPKNTWTLFPRDGGWILKYLDAGKWRQKRVPKECVKRVDAELYARTFVQSLGAQKSEPIGQPANDTSPTMKALDDWWTRLLESRPNLRESTKDIYKSCWSVQVLVHPLASVPIAQLDVPVCRRFVRELTPKVAPFYLRTIVNAATTMLDDVIAEKKVPGFVVNPLRDKSVRNLMPKAQTLAGEAIFFTQAQALRLIMSSDVPEPRRVRYAFAALTGERDGEIAGAKIRDLYLDDPNQPHAKVVRQYTDKGLKGGGQLTELKSESSARSIPLHPFLLHVLRHWVEVGWERWTGKKPQPDSPLFPNANGEHWRPKSARFLREDLRAAKLPDQFMVEQANGTKKPFPYTFHALRRSFATWLEEADVQRPVINALLGHEADSTADKHYTARQLPRLGALVARIRLGAMAPDEPTIKNALGAHQAGCAPRTHELLAFSERETGLEPATLSLGS